jgi:hypothetical protein
VSTTFVCHCDRCDGRGNSSFDTRMDPEAYGYRMLRAASEAADAWHTDSMQWDHDMGLHDVGNGYGGAPNVNCTACFPVVRPRVEPLAFDPDADTPF